MIIPIRCFTCGKVIADKYDSYLKKVREYRKEEDEKIPDGEQDESKILGVNFIKKRKDGELIKFETPEYKALKFLQIERYCCRRHFLTHSQLLEEI